MIREEIDAIGGQEMLLPGAPARRALAADRAATRSTSCSSSQRPQGRATTCSAMTHEEAITFHIAREVRSYRELPKILYHVQVKERDEPRPRAGVLRTREFTMKDSYSFDRDDEGLDAQLRAAPRAPTTRIFDRCGVRWYEVESDVGMMGGSGAARVHGARRGGRERDRARARLRGQRRGRLAPSRSRSSCRRRWTSPARCPPRA